MRSGRQKRASAEDLYRACKQGADCIPDVVQKFEHNTPADNILKWGSAAVYLGGLTIGSGPAKPAQPGLGWQIPKEVPYRPLGPSAGSTRPSGGWQIPREGVFQLPGSSRPGLGTSTTITDTILPGRYPSVTLGSSDISVGALPVGPDAPSVITPETVPTDPGTGGLSIITEAPDTVSVTIDVGATEGDIAVLEVPATESVDRTTTLTTRSGGSKHSYQVETSVSILGETSHPATVFIGGENVGGASGETIELQEFSQPRTSTPETSKSITRRGVGNLFSRRYYTQVQVTDPKFLSNPQAYITESVFDNAAFEGDIDDSIAFPDVQNRPYPRNTDVLDVARLSRVQYTRSPQGTLGVSRVGTTSTIQTRSGLNIGKQLHYRYALEPIEEIELDDLRTTETIHDDNEDAILVTGSPKTHTLDAQFDTVSDSALLEDNNDSLRLGHLTFADHDSVETFPIPTADSVLDSFTIETSLNVPESRFTESDDSYTAVDSPSQPTPGKRKYTDWVELIPAVYIDSDASFSYYFVWHPHLYTVKKRRKLWYM
ncbi:L2 minor capsid protein [Bos taurus papillomavirus 33]|nr:L2 minor capsid protein [Bos taurus papillomavirus 33]